jgi:hypothetical protein
MSRKDFDQRSVEVFAFQLTLGSASLRTWLSVFELFSPRSIARQFSIWSISRERARAEQ